MRQGGEGRGQRRKMNVSVTMGGAAPARPHQWEGRVPGRTASRDENERREQSSVQMFSAHMQTAAGYDSRLTRSHMTETVRVSREERTQQHCRMTGRISAGNFILSG